MSSSRSGDIISRPEAGNGELIRVERVWQHRHDLDIRTPKPRHNGPAWLMLAAGGLMLGAISVVAYSDPGPTHTPLLQEVTASHPDGREAVAASTRLQNIVDTARAPMTANITETQAASAPYTVIPTKRPVFEGVRSRDPEKMNRLTSATTSTKVLRYDRCNPGCNTRDPLVAGTIPPRNSARPSVGPVESTDLESSSGAAQIAKTALNGAGLVLIQTATLPFTTLKFGRDAAMKMSEQN